MRSTSQACFSCGGILAQKPSWPYIDHFSLVSADYSEQTWPGFLCTFFKDRPMALRPLIWQTKRAYSTTLNSQNHTSSFPSVLGDARLASLHPHLESHSWSCTNSCCCRLHVAMSPCFTALLERGPGSACVFQGTSESKATKLPFTSSVTLLELMLAFSMCICHKWFLEGRGISQAPVAWSANNFH